MPRMNDVPYAPLNEHAKRTADYMRVKEEDERILERHGYGVYKSDYPTQQ